MKRKTEIVHILIAIYQRTFSQFPDRKNNNNNKMKGLTTEK